MLNLIAFILTIAGCINWLLIGLLQYDFVAGLFGYQASIFSRLIYIVIGISAIYVVFRMLTNKGSFKLYQKFKKKENHHSPEIQVTNKPVTNTESAKEVNHNYDKNSLIQNEKVSNNSSFNTKSNDSIFDEHFNN
ncbi:MAG: DUF378 domain-containing protein [Clostridia bacterium]|nr:DUF378 domain-containing protein [Clostridia bacterium]